jgi:hypothetical protein
MTTGVCTAFADLGIVALVVPPLGLYMLPMPGAPAA